MAPSGGGADAADTTKVDKATKQVEPGAKKTGEGKVGQGLEETAKGIGDTIVESAKFTGEKFKEAGKAAERPGIRYSSQPSWRRHEVLLPNQDRC